MAEIPAWSEKARVVMLGRAGCHLCEEAWSVIERVTDDLGADRAEQDLGSVPEADREEYWDKIPVTFVDGRRHDFWRVSEGRLRAALSP
ncbi:thioredoxin family protein [Nocardiopsis terrae]|uniref:Glutaredoxin n=1 Tax=Nocardiopsis terrae TaxID=372655 RepID=A0ABR9HAN1_9ACTN|nr:glutaredoxin family protein [Nocardiopsis terrae]MBE1456092.1 glutaredoxin [Nocardiopsis terrae]GHC95925.1 thioredoxin family protein [Nocardiopsis terrae]